MGDYKITIRGVSGWRRHEEDRKPAEPTKTWEADLSTPDKRLEAFKAAVAEGAVEMAPLERGGFVVQWSAEGIGFGELTVVMKDDGSLDIDNEAMSREFCEAVLLALLRSGVTTSESAEAHYKERAPRSSKEE